ncbi:MAG: N-formylglutamate amidohydrolase [Paracoccaceae bacterium]|nr:N-formylglutamate amidohydrolase [Paracoccaceae bacterium]
MSDRGISPVVVSRESGASGIVLVCEHASKAIPEAYGDLGLSAAARDSHIAWDPGALGVAQRLSELLDAPLVAGGVSRLIYDCNRPPEAPGAMPVRSEAYDIPGNAALDASAKAKRVAQVYAPFKAALSEVLSLVQARAMITIHSFTPVYLGQPRAVEIGVLHDADTRLADVMMAAAQHHTDLTTRRNDPYGPQDGVTHTLQEHGVKRGLLNVMLEVRNDLIATQETQSAMADTLAPWLAEAVAATLEPQA